MFGHGYALLIAVDENEVPSLALPIVKKDVTRLKEVITHPERCGYKEDSVEVLAGPEATRAKILDGLNRLKKKLDSDTDANQTALIYYSGHGHREQSGESFLVPYDFRFPVGLGALPAKAFAALIDEMKPRRSLIVLDCCHAEAMDVKDLSDRGFKSMALTAEVPSIAALATGQGRAVLSSSRGDQQSWIRKDGQMSVFTYHLVEALTGHIGRAREPEVLVTEVMDYVGRTVPATARIERNADQQPVFKFSGTAFPIALVLGGKGIPEGGVAPDPAAELPGSHIESHMDVDTLNGKGTEATSVALDSLESVNEVVSHVKAGKVSGGSKLFGVRVGKERR